MPQLDKEYIQTGKVKVVMRDFPLPSHTLAQKASEAALCAGDQDKYWPMHDALFANQSALSPYDLTLRARELALDVAQFQGCLDSGKYATQVTQDRTEAVNMGVRSIPTFLIGRTEPNNGNVKVLQVIQGAKSFASFKQTLDALLAQK